MIRCAIVGAQKCATSSILYSLSNHPEISIHTQREMSYFINDELYSQGWDTVRNRYFKQDDSRHLTIKNVGLMYQEYALDRLRTHNKDVKIVVSLRDPVKRALSAYDFFKMQGKEHAESFQKALTISTQKKGTGFDYFGRGDYYQQVKNIFDKFPRENVEIILTEDLANNSEEVFRNIALSICGTDRSDWTPNSKRANSAKTSRNPKLSKLANSTFPGRKLLKTIFSPKLRDSMRSKFEKINSVEATKSNQNDHTSAALKNYYSPRMDQLSELIDRDLSSWCK